MYQKSRYYTNEELLRISSLAYSRTVLSDILYFDDYRRLDDVDAYTRGLIGNAVTYMDILKMSYRTMLKKYRGEYVYKNELINKWLLKHYGVQDTVYFSEFKVKDVIADIAMFNGESKAFEIKSELDSPKRLEKQMQVYTSIFDKCYVVVPDALLDEYLECTPETVGVITLEYTSSRVKLEEKRAATKNDVFDIETLMCCLKTSEYQNIVRIMDGILPDAAGFDMFDACKKRMYDINVQYLRKLWVAEVKKRKTPSRQLRHVPMEMRQAFLSLNLSESKAKTLISKLQKTINI